MENCKQIIDGLILEYNEFVEESKQSWDEVLSSIKPNEQPPKFNKEDKVNIIFDSGVVYVVHKIWMGKYSYRYELLSTDREYRVIVEEKYLTTISNE